MFDYCKQALNWYISSSLLYQLHSDICLLDIMLNWWAWNNVCSTLHTSPWRFLQSILCYVLVFICFYCYINGRFSIIKASLVISSHCTLPTSYIIKLFRKINNKEDNCGKPASKSRVHPYIYRSRKILFRQCQVQGSIFLQLLYTLNFRSTLENSKNIDKGLL